MAIVRLLNELYDDTTKRPFVNSKTKPALDKEKLEKMIRKLGKISSQFFVYA